VPTIVTIILPELFSTNFILSNWRLSLGLRKMLLYLIKLFYINLFGEIYADDIGTFLCLTSMPRKDTGDKRTRCSCPQCLNRWLGGSHSSSGYDEEKSQLSQIKPWPSNLKFITLLTAIMIWPKQLHSKIVIKHFLLALVTHQCDCTGILMTCMHTCWCWCSFYD
jgi:hypothetical protein